MKEIRELLQANKLLAAIQFYANMMNVSNATAKEKVLQLKDQPALSLSSLKEGSSIKNLNSYEGEGELIFAGMATGFSTPTGRFIHALSKKHPGLNGSVQLLDEQQLLSYYLV